MNKKGIRDFLGDPTGAPEKVKKNLLLEKEAVEESTRILKEHGKSMSEYINQCLKDLIEFEKQNEAKTIELKAVE